MAEAAIDRPRFFCHKCTAEISPVLPDYICPTCNGGFIEQIENNESNSTDHSDESSHRAEDRRHSLDADGDPLHTLVFSTLWNEVLNDSTTGNRQLQRTSPTSPLSSSSSSSTTSPQGGHSSSSSRNPTSTASNRTLAMQSPAGRTTFTFHQRGGHQPPSADMIAILQQLLGMANPPGGGQTGPGGIYFPVQMFNIHGSPRDYAWGEGGLDAVITQLLNNAEGQGPPPAPATAIQTRLTDIEISNVHIEQSQECPVCKEDFKVDEKAKQLPCTHFFHPQCVVTWLEMHNTCPVCRHPITETAAGSSAR